MHVVDAIGRHPAVAFRKRILARYQRVARVPNNFEVGVAESVQHARRFSASRDIACVFVLKADDQVVVRRFLGKPAQRSDDAVKTLLGLYRSPVRKYPDDAGAGTPGDLEGALREARLILKRVLRSEDVLLEAGIDCGSIGQHTLEERRGD